MGVCVMEGKEPIFAQKEKGRLCEIKMEMVGFSCNNHLHVPSNACARVHSRSPRAFTNIDVTMA